MDVRQTIEQLGGLGKLVAMAGARDFVRGENSLHFGFRGSKKFNKVVITLNSMDTYDVRFVKLGRMCKITADETVNGVYCDQLKNVFEDRTGLALSL